MSLFKLFQSIINDKNDLFSRIHWIVRIFSEFKAQISQLFVKVVQIIRYSLAYDNSERDVRL